MECRNWATPPQPTQPNPTHDNLETKHASSTSRIQSVPVSRFTTQPRDGHRPPSWPTSEIYMILLASHLQDRWVRHRPDITRPMIANLSLAKCSSLLQISFDFLCVCIYVCVCVTAFETRATVSFASPFSTFSPFGPESEWPLSAIKAGGKELAPEGRGRGWLKCRAMNFYPRRVGP